MVEPEDGRKRARKRGRKRGQLGVPAIIPRLSHRYSVHNPKLGIAFCAQLGVLAIISHFSGWDAGRYPKFGDGDNLGYSRDYLVYRG